LSSSENYGVSNRRDTSVAVLAAIAHGCIGIPSRSTAAASHHRALLWGRSSHVDNDLMLDIAPSPKWMFTETRRFMLDNSG
jgi:hypothetical protein